MDNHNETAEVGTYKVGTYTLQNTGRPTIFAPPGSSWRRSCQCAGSLRCVCLSEKIPPVDRDHRPFGLRLRDASVAALRLAVPISGRWRRVVLPGFLLTPY